MSVFVAQWETLCGLEAVCMCAHVCASEGNSGEQNVTVIIISYDALLIRV